MRGCPLPSGDIWERLSGVPAGRSQPGLTPSPWQLLFSSGWAQPETQPLLHHSQAPAWLQAPPVQTWTQTWALTLGLTSQLDLASAMGQWDGPWLESP